MKKLIISILIAILICNLTYGQITFRTAYNKNCKYRTDNYFKWTGSCKDGYAHGYGTIYWCDQYGNNSGSKYVGDVWYGRNEGYGTQYFNDGTICYQGNWSNDFKNGKGTRYYSNGYYTGNWENDKRSGYGEYFWNSGGSYKGNWSNDEKNGYGREELNGSVYEGYFVNGKFVGTNNTVSFSYIASDKYGYSTLSSSQTSYWQYYVPANTLGVFTLKNTSNSSDFDIYVYSSESMSYRLDAGTNSGTSTELVTVPIESYGRYIYIKIVNSGNYSSTYNFYPHFVDFAKKGEEALVEASAQYLIEEGLKWLFDIKTTDNNYDQNDKDVGRASAIIMSTLKGDDLGSMTKSVVINELTTALRDEFGYGFWGNLLVNYAIGITDDVYKNYW